MNKILKHTALNLKESFCRSKCQNTYNLWNNETDLALPKPKTEFLKKSLKYGSAMLWNYLSQEAKLSETLMLDHTIRYIYTNVN